MEKGRSSKVLKLTLFDREAGGKKIFRQLFESLFRRLCSVFFSFAQEEAGRALKFLGNKLTHYRIVVNHQAAKERERENKNASGPALGHSFTNKQDQNPNCN